MKIRHSRHWRAVMKLVEDPYWNRLWIIQEIAHASQRLICCRDDTLSWDAFCFFLRGQRSGIAQRSRAVPAIDRQNLVIVPPAPTVALTWFSLDRALPTQLVQFRYAHRLIQETRLCFFDTDELLRHFPRRIEICSGGLFEFDRGARQQIPQLEHRVPELLHRRASQPSEPGARLGHDLRTKTAAF